MTVKVTLAENTKRVAAANIPIWHRSKTALEWSLTRYLGFLAILLAGALLALVAVILNRKLGAIITSEPK